MNLLDDFSTKVRTYRESNPSGWKKWIAGVAIAAFVFAALAIVAILVFLKNKEISSLRRERDLVQEEAKRHEADAKAATLETEQELHILRAEEAFDRVKELDAKIKSIQREHDRNYAIIESIRSWDDVDSTVR